MDQSQPCSPTPPGAGAKNSDQEQHTASPSSAPSSAQPAQNSDGKSTPPTVSQPATTTPVSSVTTASSTSLAPPSAPSVTTAPSATSTPSATTAPSAPAPVTTSPTNLTRNPLKLSQVPAHLQPIKSWMTVAPVPRAPPGEKITKLGSERRGSKDSVNSDTPARLGVPPSRKSSVVSTDGGKETASTKPQDSKSSAVTNPSPSNTSTSSSQDRPPQTPQTPTPAQTPTIAGTSRSGGTALVPTAVSFALPNISLPNIALPNTLHRDTDEKDTQETGREATPTTQSSDTSGSSPSITSPSAKPVRNPSLIDGGAGKPSPVLGKRTVASSSSAGDRPDDSLAQRRKLSDAMQPSPKSEAVTTGIGSLNLAATLSPQTSNMSNFPPEGQERGSPLFSPLGSPGAATKPTDQQQSWTRSQQTSGSKAHRISNLAREIPHNAPHGAVHRADVTMAEVKAELEEWASRPLEHAVEKESKVDGLREDVVMEEVVTPKTELRDGVDTSDTRPSLPRQSIVNVPMSASAVKPELGFSQMAEPAPSPYLPSTPAFAMAAQGAYELFGDQEKAKAMAMARTAAASKLDKQLELQMTKERKLSEDIEKFKESSRTRKEKALKQRTHEVIEPPTQDRRAQPVRQINQQQGRQSNPDSPALRSQSQNSQRVASSPQEQQRLAYATRQSRSGARVDPVQNTPVNMKPQHRQEQQPVPVEQIDPTGGQVSKQQVHRDPFPTGDRPESREQMEMLCVEVAPRQHRRINSMDHRFQLSQPGSPVQFDPSVVAQQQVMPDGRYGQPHSKRLDLGQHGDPKHRRSHSDVGIFYKPIATAIVSPQPIARPPQGPAPMEVTSSPQAPPLGQPGVEYRQNGQFSQGQRPSPAGLRPEVDESWAMHNSNSNGPTPVKEAPPPRESKARLQFILNDDPTSPEEQRHDDDQMERPPSPEAPEWNRRNPPAEPVQRAAHMAYTEQPRMANDYAVRDHQESRLIPQGPPSMAAANPTRRQPSKKQKLSQDMTGQDPVFVNAAEEYEYHMRQSQMHPQARPPPHSSQQRPPFSGDRWPQQGSMQQHPQPSPQAMQGQPQPSAGPPQAGARRVLAEGPAPAHQQPSHSFSGPDMSQHGPSMGRPSTDA
ncbi:hypothetical protein BGX23_000993 [Mortierella sp. AD031]|nr:hypothetical protein BGX23_000993 [Mortierella sp. AD031]